MMRTPAIIILSGLILAALPFAAADAADSPRILVTIDDPAIARYVHRGAPRPGYGRRRGPYTASPGVRRQARELAERYAIRIVEEWPIVPLSVHCIVYAVDDADAVESLLATMRKREDIDSVQTMRSFEANGSVGEADNDGDPYANVQHSIGTLGLRDAHRWSTGDGIRIAIIDTGADLGHADLADQIDEFRDFVDDEPADSSSERHGTAVAGVISALSGNAIGIVGVAPAAEASLLRACWHTDDRAAALCNTLTIAKALAHAIDIDADVINLSLNGPSDPLLERLVNAAMRHGAIVVAAAPPESEPAARLFPSSLEGVNTLPAHERPAGAGTKPASLLAAPGVDILVLVPDNSYDFASGSSLAAAHVSGIVSLLLAREPGLDSSDVVELLIRSRPAVNRPVHACRALAALLGESGCGAVASSHYPPADEDADADRAPLR